MNKLKLILVLLFFTQMLVAQVQDRWQQRVRYQMDIDMDVNTHRFTGKQKLVYTNNSPDQLDKVFYHLYFNAFQPGSMMDTRSRTITDPDRRVGDRISKLSKTEVGFHNIKSLKQDGKDCKFEVVGTILEVDLAKPIKPQSVSTFVMEFESQVPIQVRRSGRNSSEGVNYSMAQWYPKLCEYDYQGWHANPYVGREFHGVWGDFEVNISIDRSFTIAATGALQNAAEIGKGYESEGMKVKTPKGDKLTWKFKAQNVHDFVWGADDEYKHTKVVRDDGLTIRFFYIPSEKTNENWGMLPKAMDKAFDFVNKKFGQYPYANYSFIQGGDGGMEYPQATLITGHRTYGSLVGVSVHELMHSWYQMALGTNESLYAWMDEGFTSYTSDDVMNHLAAEGLLPGRTPTEDPHDGDYAGYANIAKSGLEEPLSTHSDHFNTNYAYSLASYVKGAVFLNQMRYIIGQANFDQGMLNYYNTWKFKHPNDNDFVRVMEKVSGLELDWYREYWVNTTHTIDYAVKGVSAAGKKTTTIELERVGIMPMPLDVLVVHDDGEETLFNIPLRIMRGEKPAIKGTNKTNPKKKWEYKTLDDWGWVYPAYSFEIPCKISEVQQVIIDPAGRMADIDRSNNQFIQEKE